MNAPACITIDFETFPIGSRPDYPPRPVGVAIKWPQQASHYHAWGHPTNNNCSMQAGVNALAAAWSSSLPLLFHHSKFDLAVACEKLGAPMPPWDRVHDTMFQYYLADPHARSLGLKELAAAWLQWMPDERDELAEWIMSHAPQLLQAYPWNVDKPNKRKINPSEIGAWIFAAPGDIVGKYACGDVDRTAGLFEYMWPIILRTGMMQAYDRERAIQPIFMENERVGMRTDLAALERDLELYGAAFELSESWLRRELGASGLNFDADADVANVLLQRGIVPADKWVRTKDGQLSVSKDNLLPEYFTDQRIANALGYRNRLKTCMTMFMRPWLEQAGKRKGYISTNWNQVRNPEGGTRTGRPSTSNPNFLNLSKSWEGRDDGYNHPTQFNVPPLPLVRRYILPDDGHVFLHRDFDGQELRIFAHFEQGDLWEQYQRNPNLDPHAFVGEQLTRVTGRDFTAKEARTKVKVLNFQSLYGGGAPALQRKLRVSLAEAKEFKAFHNQALPGRKLLDDVIKTIVKQGIPIRTWGGRLYYPEPPGMVDGQRRSKEYKLINYLVQGSAADVTKQSLIDWYYGGATARFLVTVYDENNISALLERAREQMAWLKEVMERKRLSVPMTSSPKHGLSWGDAKKCPPEKGCELCR